MKIILETSLLNVDISKGFESMTIKEGVDIIFPSIELFFNSNKEIKTLDNDEVIVSYNSSLTSPTYKFLCSELKMLKIDESYHYRLIGYSLDYKKSITDTIYFNIYPFIPIEAFLNTLFLTTPLTTFINITQCLLGPLTILEGIEKLKSIFNIFYFKDINTPNYYLADKLEYDNLSKPLLKSITDSDILEDEIVSYNNSYNQNKVITYYDYDINNSTQIPYVVNPFKIVKRPVNVTYYNNNFNVSEFYRKEDDNNKNVDMHSLKIPLDLNMLILSSITKLSLTSLPIVYNVYGIEHYIKFDENSSYTKIICKKGGL